MYRWDRITLKEKAKMAMKRNYLPCVLAAFFLSLFGGSFTIQINYSWDRLQSIQLTPKLLGIGAALVCASTLLHIFVFSPLQVGGCRFFVENTDGRPSVNRLLTPFNGGSYGRIVGTLFLRDLYIFFWGLLFIVPGIVKAYEYYMISYLLAEHPEMSRREIFAESRRLMTGQKFNTFLLELSFLGWALLGTVTMGIVDVLFTMPYQNATGAELYLALSREPESNGYGYDGYGGNNGYDGNRSDDRGGYYD